MSEKRLAKIEERLSRLEEAILSKKAKGAARPPDSNFSGATRGVRFLIANRFFDSKTTLAEIRMALSKNGYHYSVQAVQMAVARLSKRTGPLAALNEGGAKDLR